MLQQVSTRLGPCEVAVHDAGASIADMQTAHMPRFVVRLDRNCTARRNQLPAQHEGRGRPLEYGALVRPLARTYKGRMLPATVADVTTQFTYEGRTIRVRGWRDVVRSEQKVAADNMCFTIWVYDDPLYRALLVLGTNVAASPATIFQLYLDRWPVEEVPLVCKQLLGLQRQFVFAALARWRLPESASSPPTSWRIWRRSYPPSPPASGIANRGARPAACGACWGRPVFRPNTPGWANSGKTCRDGPLTQGGRCPSPP